MSQQDICKLRLELLPMIQDIVSEWLIMLFFVNTPAESTSMEDFSFKLSSLQIGRLLSLENIPQKLIPTSHPFFYWTQSFSFSLQIAALIKDHGTQYLGNVVSHWRIFFFLVTEVALWTADLT